MDTLNAVFYLNLALLFTHELDAIRHHEWRIFFFLKPFDDETAYRIFTGLHVPLFMMIIALADDQGFWILMDIFLIIHLGLHLWFRSHSAYEFNSFFSNSLIVGAALSAALHLLLLFIA